MTENNDLFPDGEATYAFGDAIDETKANYGHAILGKTSPVRDRVAFPNQWGALEVRGAVWEWREDWYGSYEIGGVDPTGAAIGAHRVVRGGSWASDEKECRAAERSGRLPGERSDSVGFRLVMEGAE